MKQHNPISQGFAGVLLLLLFLLPSLVNLHHNFFEHQELSCTSGIDIHVHETELHCDFDDYNWNTPSVVINFQYHQPFLATDEVRLDTYSQPAAKTPASDLFRRGPPGLS
jgi:hypothetical protein